MQNDVQLHFQNIQQIIRQGKAGAWQAVNAHTLLVNWQIGAYLSQRLTERSYGEKVVANLAAWLHKDDPTLKGYDRRSLYRMRVFFETWHSADWSLLPSFMQENKTLEGNPIETPAQKIVVTASPQSPNIPPILLRINWSQHIDLLGGCTSHEERLFYLVLAIKDRYDVRELRRQIKSALFERQMLAKRTLVLPEDPKKELLAEVFRDRYSVEFLNLKEPHSEFELKKALVANMRQFLLELGRDFMFLEEEMHLQVGMNDYFVDLVFFHRELQCLVAFDLKIEDFKPEHLGKMNFYLELLDRDIKKTHENPSIGVLLCKSKNEEVVEIALSRQLSPTLVAAYQTKFLDKKLLQRLLHDWSEAWAQQHDMDF